MEFYSTEPFLPERVDLAGALIATIVRNVNRPKTSKASSIEDFMIVASTLRKMEQAAKTSDEKEAEHLRSTMLLLGSRR